jgi:hypothetical protein
MKIKYIIKIVLLLLLLILSLSSSLEYPTCGDCYCVSNNNGADPCPSNSPQIDYSSDVINIYKNQQPEYIYTLNCNPYNDDKCSTVPIQQYTNLSTSVCGIIYNDTNTNCSTYKMITFQTMNDALKENAYVTHIGSCGLCSTTVDLSVYLKQDFTSAGKKCATIGLINEKEGIKCYQEIGLTYECAKIWNYDGIYDGKICGNICLNYLTKPNNGPPPECNLNQCLECDEDNAGPIFSLFAGRTRRRSGLLSEIIRNCSSISNLTHNPSSYC